MLTFALFVAMFVIGFLSGVIAIISYCVRVDNKLVEKHGEANVVQRFPEVGILFQD